ncbi:MAG: (S)-ureidoglycine aminohydrolase [Candidatus Solibacter sp.]
MIQLGQTRSVAHRNHALLTPDTFVRAPLPGMIAATAIVHTAPAMGAAFTQYTAEFETGGRLGACATQRFLYVLEGELAIEEGRKKHRLPAGDYAYLPDGDTAVSASKASRAAVIEKVYQPLRGTRAPKLLIGAEGEIEGQPLMGDDWVTVRKLLPEDPAFDFAVNTMTYAPGATLPMVEVHVMEHGLLMLDGGGIYRLDDKWYAASAGDFIWMGPYCPQWFGALGKSPAKYLLYKDWNRHPLP